MKRREFLKATVATGMGALAYPAFSMPEQAPIKPFELDEVTLDAIHGGPETARSLCEKYLARIADIDKGVGLNSIIELNPEAEAIADAMDKERAAGKVRSPLHGIPVLIKDNIGTADKMRTSAGSLALAESTPDQDSYVAAQLRAAGAVILGKTNLSEWANFRSTRSTSGWSGRGGQTRNPYALDRNPCGSSSGSGAAVSGNLCVVAIGTETDGSIMCPSSLNGVVGIKPTVGLIGRSGIIPISHNQDTAGPMARTVRDAALLLGVLAGFDANDAAPKHKGPIPDYTQFLDPKGLKGARIGIARKSLGFSDSVDALMASALDTMKRLGAELIDPADVPTSGKFDDSEQEAMLYDFKADLELYLAGLPKSFPYRTLKDLIDFNDKNRDKEMPFFGQELFHQAAAKGPLTEDKYIKAHAKNLRLSRKEGIDAVMDKYKLDAIVAPTGGPAWTTDLVNGDHFSGGSSSPAAVAGYPNVNVPAGFVRGLPVGISFFGRAWSEPVLIRIAYAFEQATMCRKAPRFLPTADLSA